SCEPACPEEIPLVDMILELRRQQPLKELVPVHETIVPISEDLLLAGEALRRDPERLKRIASLLDIAIAADDGSDISRAIECGAVLPSGRISSFISAFKNAKRLVVADGLLLRKLREWLPEARVVSLGEALSTLETVRAKLCATDLYVIEPR